MVRGAGCAWPLLDTSPRIAGNEPRADSSFHSLLSRAVAAWYDPCHEAPGESWAGGPGHFSTTHWSLVVAAGDRQSPQSRQALEALCRRYWFPLYAYVRLGGVDAHEAQDLTQEFFARFLAKD